MTAATTPVLLTTEEAAALVGLTADQFRGRHWPKVFTRYAGRGAGRRRLYAKVEVDEAAQHQATLAGKEAVRRLRREMERSRQAARQAG